ncbi:MAG: hypothetical protein GXZ13_01250 [Synergistaceae bacterium]|nr:hypothetical protein [Synergistaceae bacterium]
MENYFSYIIKYIKSWVAAFFIAATLTVCISPAYSYSVNVEGLSGWQEKAVSRSLNAVAQKLSSGMNSTELIAVFTAVSEKLFKGYRLDTINVDSQIVSLKFIADQPPNNWALEFNEPQIKGAPLEWFKSDLIKAKRVIELLVEGLPLESLAWCDIVLKEEIEKELTHILPGWRTSFVVFSKEELPTLEVTFSPEMPVILAFNSSFISNSLPTLLQGDVKQDLMKEFSLFIGLPVLWVQLHSKEINNWAENFLQTRGIVEKTASFSKVEFKAAPLSQMNVKLESRRYSIGAWASVYAGTKEKSAEFGVHLGKRVEVIPNWIMEVYGEGIIQLQDWNPEGRLGVRWSPWGDIWLGGEWSSRDDLWWVRLNIDPRLRKPYAWVRIREDGELNTALGWKATEYISFELHYDSRDSNMLGLRILGNL